jgi:uncharacterized membrane protein
MKASEGRCAVCGKQFPVKQLIPADAVSDQIGELIRIDLPGWCNESLLCRHDLNFYRSMYVRNLLKREKGELGQLEHEIIANISAYDLSSRNLEEAIDDHRTFGERMADVIASFGGSWRFILLFFVFLATWVSVNLTIFIRSPFDPYPFIFLNLILSCIAAIQAPVIMMSQNRQEAKDRLRSEHDYQVNLRAELEIRNLQEKLDQLLARQWERLNRIQEVQIEILQEVARNS